MSAFSDYLESGLLNGVLRGETYTKPSHIAIALTSGVPSDSDTGTTIPEIPSGINGSGTGYARLSLGNPATSGNSMWTFDAADFVAGSGQVKNTSTLVFDTALVDWGWVSGIAIVDSPIYGSGNVLFRAALGNARLVYTGDALRFEPNVLKVKFN